MRLVVLIACHNRRELTISCIRSAKKAADHAKADISFIVFDDGSSDGTTEAVSALSVDAEILHGNGSAFWAKSMALAEAEALKKLSGRDHEFVLWLNDDVNLDRDAFSLLASVAEEAPCSVIVGPMRDPVSFETTYSGMRSAGFHPLRFEMVAPSGVVQQVETFNGNLVMVPVLVAKKIGGIDGGFSHALADIDYGLRLGRAGVPVVLAPRTLGTCRRNEIRKRGNIRADWKAFIGPKGGGNYASLKRILRKSHRRSWACFITATYSLWWVRRVLSSASRKTST